MLIDPDTWASYASTFLIHTPLLTHLSLCFCDEEWKDSAIVFGMIANRVVLPHLEDLALDGLRCSGMHLKLFLKKNNNGLKCLRLENLDILGPVTFVDLLGELQSFDRLTSFQCRQIAQNGFRTAFATLGMIEIYDSSISEEEDGYQLDDESVFVNVFRYHAVAEQWEGVQGKLGDLKRDVIVTNRTYHCDSTFGGYHWR
jgi:hypothetical protein